MLSIGSNDVIGTKKTSRVGRLGPLIQTCRVHLASEKGKRCKHLRGEEGKNVGGSPHVGVVHLLHKGVLEMVGPQRLSDVLYWKPDSQVRDCVR